MSIRHERKSLSEGFGKSREGDVANRPNLFKTEVEGLF